MTQPAFYITGNRMFNTLALFTSVDWLLNIKSVEVQLILFVKRFLIFPPEAADSQLAVLDFFLAHRAVPYVPCTSRHGLFAPRGIARSAAPLVGET